MPEVVIIGNAREGGRSGLHQPGTVPAASLSGVNHP
jgi:hypothetical protein